MRWRRTQPALRTGSIEFIATANPILAFVRRTNAHTLLMAFNLSNTDAHTLVYDIGVATAMNVPGITNGSVQRDTIRLPAYGALFATLS